jgi:hypothetical protein
MTKYEVTYKNICYTFPAAVESTMQRRRFRERLEQNGAKEWCVWGSEH